MLSGEMFAPTRLIFQYMKTLSNSDKLRAFIATKMKDIITFLDNNVKSTVYIGKIIHGIYHYLDMIVATTTSNTSGRLYHHFRPSSTINNDTSSLQTVIADLHTR